MIINVLVSGYGSNQKGIYLSGDKIKNMLIKNNFPFYYFGLSSHDFFDDTAKLKNINKVIEYSNLLANKTYLDSQNNFCLTIGGDHSISLGSISGISRNYSNLGVIWIDAHGDMNTYKTSPSGNIHGMILAALQGYGEKRLIDLYYEGQKIKTENIVIFGTRDLDVNEKTFMDKIGIKYFSFNYININSLKRSVLELVDYFKEKTNNIHLSIDLDSIDPLYAPGVSVPVAGGFKVEEVDYIIKTLFEKLNIVSADIVEYNDAFDNNDLTLSILESIIKTISNKVKG